MTTAQTLSFDLPGSPEQRTGILIALAHQLTRKGLNKALQSLRIETRHLGVLTAIARHGGLNQRRLGELLGLDKSVVVLIVDDLERLELAERKRNPEDRRAHAVHITDEGRRRVKAAQKVIEQFGGIVFFGFTKSDRRQLDRLLRRIILNCERKGGLKKS